MAEIKPEEVRTLRPGWKTTEFYVSLAGGVIPWLIPNLPPTWQAAVTTAAGAVYALARGLAKLGIGR